MGQLKAWASMAAELVVLQLSFIRTTRGRSPGLIHPVPLHQEAGSALPYLHPCLQGQVHCAAQSRQEAAASQGLSQLSGSHTCWAGLLRTSPSHFTHATSQQMSGGASSFLLFSLGLTHPYPLHQGLLSRVLQPVRGRVSSPALMTPKSALPIASRGKG